MKKNNVYVISNIFNLPHNLSVKNVYQNATPALMPKFANPAIHKKTKNYNSADVPVQNLILTKNPIVKNVIQLVKNVKKPNLHAYLAEKIEIEY